MSISRYECEYCEAILYTEAEIWDESVHGCPCCELRYRYDATLERERQKNRQIADLREALLDSTSSLVAAVSLLDRGGEKAAPSSKMFNQMLEDYKKSIERARAALADTPEDSHDD